MKIFVIQEFCDRDCNDCPDCNGGLYHHSAIYATQAAARQAIEENLRELMALEIGDGFDPDKVEFGVSIIEEPQYNQGHNDSWKHEAHYGDKVSQWYYHMYEMTPCEQCNGFSSRGHIH